MVQFLIPILHISKFFFSHFMFTLEERGSTRMMANLNKTQSCFSNILIIEVGHVQMKMSSFHILHIMQIIDFLWDSCNVIPSSNVENILCVSIFLTVTKYWRYCNLRKLIGEVVRVRIFFFLDFSLNHFIFSLWTCNVVIKRPCRA